MDQIFLSLVAATTGKNCLVGFIPKEDGSGVYPAHKWLDVHNPVEVAAAANQLVAQHAVGIYFTPGAFAHNEQGRYQRRSEQCTGVRAFWLDLDAGPEKRAKVGDKVYHDADEAYADLLAKLGPVLPRPTYVINSGFGLHAYWVATADVDPDKWLALARNFKSYCASIGLKQDPARTADSASIMRVPGSFHPSAQRWVQVREVNTLFTADELLGAFSSLPVTQVSAPSGTARLDDYEYSDLLVNVHRKPCSFEKIMMLHEYDRTGCQALHDIYTHQEKQTYQEWVAILSIAKYCVDGQEWIHKVSNKYPGYSYDATEEKANSLQGVYKCSDIQALDPSRCAGCPFAGKLTSPITIGRDPENKPIKVVAQLGTDTEQESEFIIPEYPWPFYRGVGGGIYRRLGEDEESDDEEDACVFPYDFYIYERINSNGKQLYWCRYHSPHDGVKEFDLDSTMVHTVNVELKDRLTGQGMAITSKKQWSAIGMFLNASNAKLVASRAALRQVSQQGWQLDAAGRVVGFVHGTDEITVNGTKPAPIGDRNVAVKMSRALRMKLHGDKVESIDLWNACLANLFGYREAMPSQFVICTALGSVFAARYALDSHCGGLISLCSAGSGHGKTYSCMAALRVWGDPKGISFSSKSGVTNNALLTNLGYANSMPILRDEITEMEAYEIADLVYDSTRLSDKERAQGSENDIRANRNSWRVFMFATSNNSLYDVIGNDRHNGAGVMMRITEMVMPPLTHLKNVQRAKSWEKKLESIHGVAGRMLIEWMMIHPEKAEKLWNDTADELAARFDMQNQERFWITHMTAACVGARIGEELHLHPFSASAVMDFCGELLEDMRQRVAVRTGTALPPALQAVEPVHDESAIGDHETSFEINDCIDQFFIDSQPFTLVIKPHGQARLPLRGQVHVRIDENTKTVYIDKRAIREYSRTHEVSLDALHNAIAARGGTSGSTRLLSGTEFSGTNPTIRVWELPLEDPSPNRRLNVEALLNM